LNAAGNPELSAIKRFGKDAMMALDSNTISLLRYITENNGALQLVHFHVLDSS
jgi:hypothetical protein